MSETISAAWIAVAGTIAAGLAGLAGAWLGARIARDAGRQLLVDQAKVAFAAAFTQTLVELHSNISDEGVGAALDVLRAGYPSHLAAYIKLRSILSGEQRQAIDHAWKRYTRDDEYYLPQERETYRFAHVLTSQTKEHQNMLAIKHIDALLEAAA